MNYLDNGLVGQEDLWVVSTDHVNIIVHGNSDSYNSVKMKPLSQQSMFSNQLTSKKLWDRLRNQDAFEANINLSGACDTIQ